MREALEEGQDRARAAYRRIDYIRDDESKTTIAMDVWSWELVEKLRCLSARKRADLMQLTEADFIKLARSYSNDRRQFVKDAIECPIQWREIGEDATLSEVLDTAGFPMEEDEFRRKLARGHITAAQIDKLHEVLESDDVRIIWPDKESDEDAGEFSSTKTRALQLRMQMEKDTQSIDSDDTN